MDLLIGLVLLVLMIALVGFLVHLITKIPMAQPFSELIIVATIVVIVIVLLLLVTGRIPLPTLPAWR